MLTNKLIAAAIAFAAMSAPAQASVTINFGGGNSPTNGADGNILSFSNSGVSVQASGWTLNGTNLDSSWLGRYANGLGVTNDSENGWSLFNQYGVDNVGGADFILLVFNQAVNLQSATLSPVQASWTSADNDATVAYANLAGAFTSPSPTAMPANSPLWLTLGSAAYSLSGNNNSPFLTTLNSAQNYGNVWAVAATMDNPDWNADAFMLSSITVNTRAPAVPEPATWGMMLLGFGLAGAALRRRTTARGLAQIA